MKLALLAFLALHLTLGTLFMYSVAGHKEVTKGVAQSLRIGVTR